MEIIPKPTKKPAIWLNILFYCAILIFLISIVFYFALGHFLNNLKVTLQDLRITLALERTLEEIGLEQEVFSAQRKINDFSRLIENRVSAASFFDFLEGISHPRVWLTEINLNLGMAQVTVSGWAESFSVLGQQMLIFKEEPLIEKTKLSQIEINKEGGVDFEIELS